MIERRKSFNDADAFGLIAEGQITCWLRYVEQWNILPAYEIEIPSGKGPRLLTHLETLVAPDILAMKYKGRKFLIRWYESKHKHRFTWHRNSRNWQTGIDLRHYLDYIKVQEQTGVDVYVCFLHRCAIPSQSDLQHGSPATCPIGLFGQTLRHLMAHEHHRDKYVKQQRDYPMVYWNEADLERLATLEQIAALPISLWKEVTA